MHIKVGKTSTDKSTYEKRHRHHNRPLWPACRHPHQSQEEFADLAPRQQGQTLTSAGHPQHHSSERCCGTQLGLRQMRRRSIELDFSTFQNNQPKESMTAPYIYLVAQRSLEDMSAAIKLMREKYHVIRFTNAPMNIGLIYETETTITDEDMDVLGIVPWV